uniref:Uncharacterized protein n=1 Tax=Arundo donax TaxID=35708 RepID=A0A0A9HUQ2_ARUDO
MPLCQVHAFFSERCTFISLTIRKSSISSLYEREIK